MKRTNRLFLSLIILIFCLQSTVKSNDITEFEIEGFSVGESFLKYYSEEKIKKFMEERTSIWYPNKAYVSIALKSNKFKIYEEVGIVLDPTDNKFLIHSVEGTFNYQNNINACYKKQDIITSNLKDQFIEDSEFYTNTTNYSADKSGKSKVKYNDFIFSSGGAIRVICYDMSEDFFDPNDQLYLAINSKKIFKLAK